MKTYQYKSFNMHHDVSAVDKKLNEHGKEGWKLVAMVQIRSYEVHITMIRELLEDGTEAVKGNVGRPRKSLFGKKVTDDSELTYESVE